MITFVVSYRGEPARQAQDESWLRRTRPHWRITHKGGPVYEVMDEVGSQIPSQDSLSPWVPSPMRHLEISPPGIDLAMVQQKLAESGW